jgi:enterochelin esterase-like enzyme
MDDYALGRALSRLLAPPLTKSDFLGFADSDRIVRMNESLKLDPYHGLVIVMPYTPDRLRGDRPFEAARPLAQFIVDELLPRVYRETPALGTAAATGIDGVSLGGRAAIAVGLQRPTAFGVVAALQAAFDSEEAAQIAEQARRAMSRNSKLVLRLLTSDGDFFLESNRAISRELRARSVPHRLLVVNGPHDYDFNRGPGAFEMLLLHDRVLRGRPAP